MYVWDMRVTVRICAYQRVRNVRFSENLPCFLFLLSSFLDSPFCLITDNILSNKTENFLSLCWMIRYNYFMVRFTICYLDYWRSEHHRHEWYNFQQLIHPLSWHDLSIAKCDSFIKRGRWNILAEQIPPNYYFLQSGNSYFGVHDYDYFKWGRKCAVKCLNVSQDIYASWILICVWQ